jgi:hypothetical protein
MQLREALERIARERRLASDLVCVVRVMRDVGRQSNECDVRGLERIE